MNIGVFGYNFKHWKTQIGIQNLIMGGHKPKVVLAADPVPLNFYKSKIRISPKDLFLWEPQELCKQYDIPYHVVSHNSQETSMLVEKYNLDIGIILGARILKPIAFENFKIGVINMHPGVLPQNRGLDNIKWAIIKKMPQGVTSHLIDSKIDRGKMIVQENIKVYDDDSLVDVHIRVQNLEQKLMLESIKILENKNAKLLPLGEGTYHKSLPPDKEQNLLECFETYKKGRNNASSS
jgi:methionyl-tRNA formyltransferase